MAIVANNTAEPLLPDWADSLAPPVENQLVQSLCEAARDKNPTKPNVSELPDWWGDTQCQYYNAVQWDLPSASVAVHAFAVGLLKLEVPVPQLSQKAFVRVFKKPIVLGAEPTDVPMPSDSEGGLSWPASVQKIV